MVCPNCGAALPENTAACPFCGCENEKAAEAHQDADVAGIYKKIAMLLQMPVHTVRRASRILLRTAAVLACVFAAVLLASFFYARIAPEASYQRQQKQIETLEKLYQAKDYAAMNEKLGKMDDAHLAVYEKYQTVGRLFDSLSQLEESCSETAAFVAKYPEGADLLDYEMKQLFLLLDECADLEAAGYIYGEEEAAAEMESRARSLLSDVFRLTDQEIAQGMELARQDDADYSALRARSAARLAGGAA